MMTGPNPYCGDSGRGPDALTILWDVICYLAWWLMAALIITGSWWFPGYRNCAAEWVDAGPPRGGRTARRDPIAREAAQGITALQEYLDSFAPGPGQVR